MMAWMGRGNRQGNSKGFIPQFLNEIKCSGCRFEPVSHPIPAFHQVPLRTDFPLNQRLGGRLSQEVPLPSGDSAGSLGEHLGVVNPLSCPTVLNELDACRCARSALQR